MSGVAVIRFLVANYAPITSIIPSSRIRAGDLPLNTVLPAISITHISGTPRNTVGMFEDYQLHTDRVQVSVLIKNQQGTPQGLDYPGLVAVTKMLLKACRNQRGIINGVDVNSILPDTEGPDLPGDDTAILSRSRDFIVAYTEATA